MDERYRSARINQSHHVVPTGYLSKERRTHLWCSLQCCVINVDKSEPRP
jgi:hypothetical protein